MDLRYTVSLPPDSDVLNKCQDPVVSVSCESVVAFSRSLLVDGHCGSRVVYAVALADLNSPYKSVNILTGVDKIQLLQFSSDGKQLLVVTVTGNIKLLNQVSGALQPDWKVIAETTVKNETVLAATYLHDGLKPIIHLGEAKLYSLYNEKFGMVNYTPSLLAPGQCPTQGIVALTASGIIIIIAVWRPGSTEVVKTVLGSGRDHYTAADIATASDGSIHICAWQPDAIHCWRMTLSHVHVLNAESSTSNNNDSSHSNNNCADRGELLLVTELQSSQSVVLTRLAPSSTGASGNSTATSSDLKSEGNEGPANSTTSSTTAGYLEADSSWRVSHIYFPYRDDPKVLLVALETRPSPAQQQHIDKKMRMDEHKSSRSTPVCYVVQKYTLEERTVPSLYLFLSDSSNAAPTSVLLKEWTLSSEWSCPPNTRVVRIGSSSHGYLFGSSQLPHLITVATDDGTITAINLTTMMQMNSQNILSLSTSSNGSARLSEDGSKRPPSDVGGGAQYPPLKVALAHTWTDISLVAYDSKGSLHFFSLIKNSDIGTSWPLCVVFMLEYSIVSGHDWWELLINTPQSSVTTVIDKLMENMCLHPSSLSTLLHTRLLLLRTAMLRVSGSLQLKATEAMIQAHLSAIQRLFRQFRPVTVDVTHDKCASSMITSYLENRSSFDQLDLDKSVDQFLFGINQTLDCQVDQKMGKYLQPLLQYAADLALYLLIVMAQTNKNEYLREITVKLLREILFRARIWFRHNKLVAPVVMRKTDSVDVWSQLYKLLTRLLAVLPADPDASFMDEVILLETQVLCKTVPLYVPSRGFLTSLQQNNSAIPAKFTHQEHDKVPHIPNYCIEGALPAANNRDPLFLQFLPDNVSSLQCSRCWAIRSAVHDEDNPWEQQWCSRCLCSGHWMPQPLPKVPLEARDWGDGPPQ